MSYQSVTDALLRELESQTLLVPSDDSSRGVGTASCECDTHNGEPLREGETVVVLYLRSDEGDWYVERTFCNRCEVSGAYNSIGEYSGLALIEGTLVPESPTDVEAGFVLEDGFVWDLDGDR
jgi:hypothetical protein